MRRPRLVETALCVTCARGTIRDRTVSRASCRSQMLEDRNSRERGTRLPTTAIVLTEMKLVSGLLKPRHETLRRDSNRDAHVAKPAGKADGMIRKTMRIGEVRTSI